VAAPLHNGDVLIAGGVEQSGNTVGSAELFDPGSDSFIQLLHRLHVARSDAVAAPLPDGNVLIAGGANQAEAALSSAELFEPTDDAFTPLEG
jgi:hypothetical protein